jgi:hypothetical protein
MLAPMSESSPVDPMDWDEDESLHGDPTGPWAELGSKAENWQKAHYSAGVFQAIVAQAGYSVSPTQADVDLLAIDMSIEYPEAPVRVQLKCTSSKTFDRADSLRFPIKDTWRAKWDQNLYTPYMVLFAVQPGGADWMTHGSYDQPRGPLSEHISDLGPAFWAPLRPLPDLASVVFSRGKRFTAETVCAWREDLLKASQGGSPRD